MLRILEVRPAWQVDQGKWQLFLDMPNLIYKTQMTEEEPRLLTDVELDTVSDIAMCLTNCEYRKVKVIQ